MKPWRALATWWVKDPDYCLNTFKGGSQTGTSIAALKVLLGIALMSDFYTRASTISLTDLETVTGLSRPMVLKGIRDLDNRRLITVDNSKHVATYTISSHQDDSGWGKLPYDLLRAELPNITNRGNAILAALKIYVYLVSIRPNGQLAVAAKHETIRAETGIQTRYVRAGIDILINHSLIRLDLVTDESDNYKGRYNNFTLRGLTLKRES